MALMSHLESTDKEQYLPDQIPLRANMQNYMENHRSVFAHAKFMAFMKLLYLWGLLCYVFLLSWHFWLAWAALPEKYPEDHQPAGFEPNVFSFMGKLLSHLRFKMNSTEKLRI